MPTLKGQEDKNKQETKELISDIENKETVVPQKSRGDLQKAGNDNHHWMLLGGDVKWRFKITSGIHDMEGIGDVHQSCFNEVTRPEARLE